MRVCFLTHYFPPEVGAPQTRIELLALTLAADGAEVTVHTGFPHYPDGGVKAPYRNRPWLTERRDGIRIVRSAVYPAANRGFAPRLADHTAFALSALATSRRAGLLDVVVGESPPLFTAAAGAIYARSKRAAYVVNVADRWPASAVELGALRNGWAIAAAEATGALGLPPRRPRPLADGGDRDDARRRAGRRRQIASRVAGRRPRPVRRSDAESAR